MKKNCHHRRKHFVFYAKRLEASFLSYCFSHGYHFESQGQLLLPTEKFSKFLSEGKKTHFLEEHFSEVPVAVSQDINL